MKRVVITGIGVVSCLGNNQEEVYQSLLNSRSGITFAEEYKEYNLKSNIHGKPNIKLEDYVDRKVIRFMGPGSAYNYISMTEAVKNSGLDEKDVSNISTGMIMGSGGPSIENVIFKNNEAVLFGGGVRISSSKKVTMKDSNKLFYPTRTKLDYLNIIFHDSPKKLQWKPAIKR